MKLRLTPVLVLLLVLAALVLWAKPARVQESRIERWEYCSLSEGAPFSNEVERGYAAAVHYFGIDGERSESVVVPYDWRPEGPSPAVDAFERAAAKLGLEGWEMVGVSRASSSMNPNAQVAYFKRRLP